jgi:hypothetical protein
MNTPPALPAAMQAAFEIAKANAELGYSTRAEQFPHHPDIAADPLHRTLLVQRVFFAYCAQARAACRAGHWTTAQVSHAVGLAWPLICDSYFEREIGVLSDEARSGLRVTTWRTITDDPQWKQHLSDLVQLATTSERGNAIVECAVSKNGGTESPGEISSRQQLPSELATANDRVLLHSEGSQTQFPEPTGISADMPTLSADAWARIQLAKLTAATALRHELSTVRAERLRRRTTDQFFEVDSEALFQDALGFAYADYLKEIFFAEVKEICSRISASEYPATLDKVIRARIPFVLPMWAGSGGDESRRDWFIELAYKVVMVDRRYKEILERIAAAPGASKASVLTPDQAGVAEANEDESTRTDAGPGVDGPNPAESNVKGRKRGPKPNREAALRVSEIVASVAPDGDWRSKLDEICEALDEAQIPYPARWRQRGQTCKGWVDYDERANAVKAIEYRLGVAKQRKQTTPETIS